MDFTIHTAETAPQDARESLKDSQARFGFVPNLHAVMAESPPVLDAYKSLAALYGRTGLNVLERQVVLLAINYENDCDYCMAAHSTIAQMEKMPEDILAALREGRPLAEPRLEALRSFAAAMTRSRGWATDAEQQALLDAGYSRQTMQEVVLAISFKVLSNYLNHLAETPVDPQFQAQAWTRGAADAA